MNQKPTTDETNYVCAFSQSDRKLALIQFGSLCSAEFLDSSTAFQFTPYPYTSLFFSSFLFKLRHRQGIVSFKKTNIAMETQWDKLKIAMGIKYKSKERSCGAHERASRFCY